ncbi:MAG TPA: CcdB family protein [Steroidobacteraceae bacterium]|nr:CcdB family protein [Steroidobacteraceae bacterium]
MPQFSVYKNKNPSTRSAYPYLVDIQSDLLRDLKTRVVVPLVKVTALSKKSIQHLTPIVEVDGQKYLMLMPQLAGVSAKDLGPPVSDVSKHRNVIVGAIDFLVTGI